MTFPRDAFSLLAASRTFRYIDYLWADSFQLLLVLADAAYVPPRTSMPRPGVRSVRMASPLSVEVVLAGGLMSSAWWFFKYAVQHPNAIGSWWNDVKIGKARSALELEAVRDAPTPRAGNEPTTDRIHNAVSLAAEVASDLDPDAADPPPARIARRPPELSDPLESLETTVAELERLRPPSDDEGGAAAYEGRDYPPGDDPERVVRRYRDDARRLVDTAGPPEITEE